MKEIDDLIHLIQHLKDAWIDDSYKDFVLDARFQHIDAGMLWSCLIIIKIRKFLLFYTLLRSLFMLCYYYNN